MQALADRFAAAKVRGDTTHRAEEARFTLQLAGNPAAAVAIAAANYQVQREPRDARALLEGCRRPGCRCRAAGARLAANRAGLKTRARGSTIGTRAHSPRCRRAAALPEGRP
ncbi:MAG: hypothetical protein IPF60_20620 [Betaproteobacteria bacterium]|nr:hypothetical protein [Betaproteobacteria bacterium]